MQMQSYRSFAAAILGLGILSGVVSAQNSDTVNTPAFGAVVSAAPNVPVRVEDCQGTGFTCAHEFATVVTVYETNTTTAIINWVTTTTTLSSTSTITSTSIEVVTKINETETDALCEKTFTVTSPGASTVTVHINATHVDTIRPVTTSVTVSKITQYEKAVSVCLLKSPKVPLPPASSSGASGLPGSSSARPTSGGAPSSGAAPSSSTSTSTAPASSGGSSSNSRTQAGSAPRSSSP